LWKGHKNGSEIVTARKPGAAAQAAQERIAALESQGEAKKPGHRTDSAVHDQDKKKLDSGKSHA